jgi:hypothetical protein
MPGTIIRLILRASAGGHVSAVIASLARNSPPIQVGTRPPKPLGAARWPTTCARS